MSPITKAEQNKHVLKIMAKRLDGDRVNARNIAGGNLDKVNLAVNKQQSEVMMQTN